MSRDDDIESKDSFDEGGYITATQLPPTRKFVDEDQPKLLLAEDPVQPIREKRPPADEYGGEILSYIMVSRFLYIQLRVDNLAGPKLS